MRKQIMAAAAATLALLFPVGTRANGPVPTVVTFSDQITPQRNISSGLLGTSQQDWQTTGGACTDAGTGGTTPVCGVTAIGQLDFPICGFGPFSMYATVALDGVNVDGLSVLPTVTYSTSLLSTTMTGGIGLLSGTATDTNGQTVQISGYVEYSPPPAPGCFGNGAMVSGQLTFTG